MCTCVIVRMYTYVLWSFGYCIACQYARYCQAFAHTLHTRTQTTHTYTYTCRTVTLSIQAQQQTMQTSLRAQKCALACACVRGPPVQVCKRNQHVLEYIQALKTARSLSTSLDDTFRYIQIDTIAHSLSQLATCEGTKPV